MKIAKEILLGICLAIVCFVVLFGVDTALLNPHLLGKYDDPLYFFVAALVFTSLAWKVSWKAAWAFAIAALLLSPLFLLELINIYGCSIGQGAVRNAVGIRCGAFSGNMKVSFQAARSIG